MLQNMYLVHQELFGRIAPAMNGGPSHGPYGSYDEFYKDSETFWGKLESDLDSIIHEHPALSPKYINYIRNYWNVIKARNLAQASNNLPNHKLPEVALNEIVEKYWKHLPRPYTAYCGPIFAMRISLLQQFMAKDGFDPNYIAFQSIAKDENLNISVSQRETIKKYISVIDDFRKETEGLSDQEEIQKAAQAFQTEHQTDMQEIQSMMKDERLQNLINEKSYIIQLDYATHILDSIGSDRDMKDFFVGLDATAMIDGSNHSLSPAIMDIAEKHITLPLVKDGVRELNQKFLDIEGKNQHSGQSTGMSRGESLFHKLVEPYKGKIILVDFWGTWCVPCLRALSKSQGRISTTISIRYRLHVFCE